MKVLKSDAIVAVTAILCAPLPNALIDSSSSSSQAYKLFITPFIWTNKWPFNISDPVIVISKGINGRGNGLESFAKVPRGAVNIPPHPNTKPFHKEMSFGEENKTTLLQRSPHYLQ